MPRLLYHELVCFRRWRPLAAISGRGSVAFAIDFCHATPIVPRTRLPSEMDALWRPSRGVAQSLLLQTFAMPRLLYHELVRFRRWAPFGGHLGAWLSRFCYRLLPCHAYCTTNSFAFGDGRPLAAISGRGSVAFATDFCHATPIVPRTRSLSEMGALWRPSRGVAQSLLL